MEGKREILVDIANLTLCRGNMTIRIVTRDNIEWKIRFASRREMINDPRSYDISSRFDDFCTVFHRFDRWNSLGRPRGRKLLLKFDRVNRLRVRGLVRRSGSDRLNYR